MVCRLEAVVGLGFLFSKLLMANFINARVRDRGKREIAGDMQLIGGSTTMFDGESVADFGTLIWAVGRRPNTQALNLESTGVEIRL